MSTWVGIGNKRELNSFNAGFKAAKEAHCKIGGTQPDLLLAFGGGRLNHAELLKGITSAIKDVPVAGCTAAGEIFSEGVAENSLSLAAVSSDKMKIYTAVQENISLNPRKAGMELAQQLSLKLKKGSDNLKKQPLLFLISESLQTNISQMIKGIEGIFGLSCSIVGCACADNFLFSRTYQYSNKGPLTDTVTGILFAGETDTGIGIADAWTPIGTYHRITESKGNLIKKIGSEPPLSLYKEYFSHQPILFKDRLSIQELFLRYPMGLYKNFQYTRILRIPVRVTEEGAFFCQGEVAETEDVRIMLSDKNSIVESAREAAATALAALGEKKKIRLAILLNSACRKKILGRDADKELKAVKETLGNDIPIIGLYGYGQIMPVQYETRKGLTRFSNGKLVVVVFGE